MAKVIIRVNALPNELEPKIYNQKVFYEAVEKRNRIYLEGEELSFPLGRVKAKVRFYTRKPESRDEMHKLFHAGILGLIRSRMIEKIEDIEVTDCIVTVDKTKAPLTVIDLMRIE